MTHVGQMAGSLTSQCV